MAPIISHTTSRAAPNRIVTSAQVNRTRCILLGAPIYRAPPRSNNRRPRRRCRAGCLAYSGVAAGVLARVPALRAFVLRRAGRPAADVAFVGGIAAQPPPTALPELRHGRCPA